jgi:hypothetical protein
MMAMILIIVVVWRGSGGNLLMSRSKDIKGHV